MPTPNQSPGFPAHDSNRVIFVGGEDADGIARVIAIDASGLVGVAESGAAAIDIETTSLATSDVLRVLGDLRDLLLKQNAILVEAFETLEN